MTIISLIICLTTISVVCGTNGEKIDTFERKQGFFPHRPAIKNPDYDDFDDFRPSFNGFNNQFGFVQRPWPPRPLPVFPPPNFQQPGPSVGFSINFFRKNDQEIQQDDLISNGIREGKGKSLDPLERPELTRTLRFPSRPWAKKRPAVPGRPGAIKNPDFAIRVSQQQKPAIKNPDFAIRVSQNHKPAAIKFPENISPTRRNIFSATKNSNHQNLNTNSDILPTAIKISDLQFSPSTQDQSQSGIKNSPGFFKSI